LDCGTETLMRLEAVNDQLDRVSVARSHLIGAHTGGCERQVHCPHFSY